MAIGSLITAEQLLDDLDVPSLRVVEVTPEPVLEDYLRGHIPGAQAWYWKDVVWDDLSREFPTPPVLAQRLGELGIGDGTTLVLYARRNQYAIYCAWVLGELCGFADVRVLDGGKTVWERRGFPMTTDAPLVAPAARAAPRSDRSDRSRIRRDELLARLAAPAPPRLLDARYPEEYDGRRVKPGDGFDHGAERRGHIPGAVNVPYESLLDPTDGTFLPAEQLRARLAAVGATPEQADEVVAYCRLGHRGSLVWFVATQLLGYDHVRLYDGSWTEWGSMVGAPVER
jgi:thiosulfate/3-mercaptopyruvate sulfurtransferase